MLAISPRLLGSFAPVLVMAACPLSIFLVAGRLSSGGRREEAVSDDERQRLELEEEVNRLKVELAIRDRRNSA